MNVDNPAPANTSRPKIHRLPALPREERRRHPFISAILNYGNTAKFVFTLSSMAFGLVLLALIASRFFPSVLKQDIVAKSGYEAQAATALPPEGKTIVLRNENDVIIGQMAHISSPAAPTSEVRTMSSDVDKRKGRELLSIIGQY